VIKTINSERDFLRKLLFKAIEDANALKFVQFLYDYLFNETDVDEGDLKKLEIFINQIKVKKRKKEEIFEELNGDADRGAK